MYALDTWDWILLAIAAFVGVTTLLKLMQVYRDDLLKKFRKDFEVEQQRLAAEERKRKKAEAKKQAA
jgi:hypothetical protein